MDCQYRAQEDSGKPTMAGDYSYYRDCSDTTPE
jgi:hypothetical protein